MRNIRLSKYYLALILLITFCGTHITSKAQNVADTAQLQVVTIRHSDGFKSTMLRLGGSLGYGIFRDMGTAPISFKGLVAQPVVGIELSGMRKWKTTIDLYASVGAFEDAVDPKLNFGAFDISNTVRYTSRKHIAYLLSGGDKGGLELVSCSRPLSSESVCYATFSVGLGAANFLDVTVNPDYENSAAGVSDFVGPEVTLRADWSLTDIFNVNSLDKLFYKQLHTAIGLMPVAAILRPGYAYIDNYTAAQPVLASLFDNFVWSIKPFAGLYTDIGLDLINANNSRITLSYLWTYHSTGNSGFWRFDHATHFLHIDFIITLKNKPTGCSIIIRQD